MLRGLQNGRFLIFAALLILIMLFRPGGLWPQVRARRAPFIGLEDEEEKQAAERPFKLQPAVAGGEPILRVKGLGQRVGGGQGGGGGALAGRGGGGLLPNRAPRARPSTAV